MKSAHMRLHARCRRVDSDTSRATQSPASESAILRRRLPQGWAHGDPEQRFLSGATLYLPISFVGFATTAFFVSFTYQDPIYILAAFVAGLHVARRSRLQREAWVAAGRPVQAPEPARRGRQPHVGRQVRPRVGQA